MENSNLQILLQEAMKDDYEKNLQMQLKKMQNG